VAKPFTVNVNRFDPYKNYRFLVYFGETSTPVAGVSRVTGLRRSSDVIEYREGGNPVVLKGIGRTRYEPITMERGVTHDTEFEDWANAAQGLDKGEPSRSMGKLRKTIRIVLQNEAGQPVQQYLAYRCWVSEYQALPDLDAGGNAIALQHIRVENEGWERDMSVGEPDEQES
jgi:phage tail-like protein